MVSFFCGLVALGGVASVSLPVHRRTTLSAEKAATAHSGPTPVVLVGDGRTGSSITMIVLAALTGSCPAPGMVGYGHAGGDPDHCWPELFGQNESAALQIEDPRTFMADYLSRQAVVHADSPLVGFQWKTFKKKYMKTRTPGYMAAWRYLGEHHVRALRYTRNPLDQVVSSDKHLQSRQAHNELPPHCEPDDEECLKAMNVPVKVDVEHLMNFMSGYERIQRTIVEDLSAAKIQYINVTYEELVDNQNATSRLWHWRRVLEFLGVRIPITTQKLDDAFGISSKTHPTQQGANVANWQDVVDALHEREGGRYAYVLSEKIVPEFMRSRKKPSIDLKKPGFA